MTPPILCINGENRLVVAHAFGGDHLLDLIVEDIGLAVNKGDKDGVADLQVEVLDRNHPDFSVLETQKA